MGTGEIVGAVSGPAPGVQDPQSQPRGLCDHFPEPGHWGALNLTRMWEWTKDGLFIVEAPGVWSLSDDNIQVPFNLGEG